MDWSSILGVIGTGATGGIVGMVGAFGSSIFKFFANKQNNKHELAMMDKKGEAAKLGGSFDGLAKSIVAQTSLVTHKWVNDIRSLYRPALTTALLWVSYDLFNQFLAALNDQTVVLAQFFTAGEIVGILQYIVNSIVFSTAAAISWWFGDRAMSPPQWKDR